MEKKIVSLQVNDNIDETTKSVVSLKTQLRQAQQEVAELSEKFGATSKEAVEAAKKAAILKDTIGDAKALTDAFNPDAKFKALSSSLSGVASGFAAYQGALGLAGVESKDLEKQLLKVQSAMAIAEGLQGLGEARDSFKQLKAVGVNAFNAIKTAIGSTGIGLIVVAAGAIYAYWDDIKGAVSSVSEEQENLNAVSKRNLETEQKKLDTIGSQDNILKLQGKSEKEILKIKIAQTDQVIKASEIQIEQSIATSKAQTEAAKRNQDILSGVLKFISVPLTLLLKTVDYVGRALGKDFGLEDKVFGGLSSLMFDPVKTKKDGDAVVEEQRKALDKLKNDRAGLQLSINSIEKQGAIQSSNTRKEDDNKKLQERKDYLAKQQEIDDELNANLDALKVSEEEKKDAQFLTEIEKNNEKNRKLVEGEKLRTDAEKTLSESRIQDAQIELEAKTAIQNAYLDVIGQGIGVFKQLAGKNKDLQKAAIIAENAAGIARIIINTKVANAKAIAASPLTGGQPFVTINTISAALGVAGSLLATRNALKELGGGSAGGGGASVGTPASGGNSNAAASNTPIPAAAPTFNVVGTSGQNQIAQSLGNQAPVKAYVVSNDVTTAQSLDRNIVKTATLGN